ncbi:hypothetical protein Tco_1054920 [Tanacetum coccineum]|uniref:Uncharacterized protein n=1 Tax=Tanacetum coccineum TaxID=301880 RepID=A0ABQ5GY71_9ASTR
MNMLLITHPHHYGMIMMMNFLILRPLILIMIHFTLRKKKIKESKLLIDELDHPRSSDFLPFPECDLVFYDDFSEVDALSLTNNEDKVFNPGILIHENLFEVTNLATPDKNVKKISYASLILKDFNPPFYELPFYKEVLGSETLLSFSSENEEKLSKSLTFLKARWRFFLALMERTSEFWIFRVSISNPLDKLKVLALENSKTAQDLVIQQLKKRVKRLENALRERTPGMKLFKIVTLMCLMMQWKNVKGGSTAEQITTARDTLNIASINVSTVVPLNVSTAGPSNVSTLGPLNVSDVGPSTSTVGDIFEDEMTTIADTLVAIKSARPRTTSIMIHNVEEEPRRSTPVPTVQSQDKGKGKMVEPKPTLKNLRKARIQMDEELAQRLFEEEQAQFEKEQRIAREKAEEQEAKDTTLIEQMEDVQARMDADDLLAERLQQEERDNSLLMSKLECW